MRSRFTQAGWLSIFSEAKEIPETLRQKSPEAPPGHNTGLKNLYMRVKELPGEACGR